MLATNYSDIKIPSAPKTTKVVFGVGDQTRAIALEIANMGEQPLSQLTLKYQAGAGGQWFDLATTAESFTTQTTVLRKWNGDNPYNLEPGKQAALYLDVSEIWAIAVEAQCTGEQTSYPVPETKIMVNAYAIKNLGVIGGAVAPVSGGQSKTIMLDSEIVEGKAYIKPGAQSLSIEVIGNASATVYIQDANDSNSWQTKTLPPGANISWSSPSSSETYPEVRIDASGTKVAIASSGADIIVGDWATTPAPDTTVSGALTDESSSPITDESSSPLTE
jgi:hypothetical protein